jgi:hypothetical protein
LAQNINRAVQTSQDPTGTIGYETANGNIYLPGHLLTTTRGGTTSGSPPVLTGCVTGGTPSITGTDFSGSFVSGTSASTSCVVTFGTAFNAAPSCLVTWNTGPLAAMSWTTSTTALTITQTSTASVGVSWLCSGAK